MEYEESNGIKLRSVLSPVKRSYSFRSTPTRQQGNGAYSTFFKEAIKINHSNVRQALINSLNETIVSSTSEKSSLPNTSVRVRASRQATNNNNNNKNKENDPDFAETESHVSISTDDSGESEAVTITIESSPEKTPSKSILKTKQAKTPTTASKRKSTALTRRSTIGKATPGMQKRTQSKIQSSKISDYEKARIKLHVTNTPDCLPCRENQFSDIYTFIETHIKNQTGGCMYVCGVPGTGKTLTVRQVILCLYESVSMKLIQNFKFVDVNAFQVTEPYQIYKLIYKELTGENVSAEHAVMLLEKKFEQKSSETIVLLVDELDMLCTKKQDILYNLFDWPYKKNSKWIVIAIANAMNLPEQVMMNKISSRLGLTRMNFQPYTFQELQEIVSCRLKELNIFDSDAIVFASRKVAAVSGDARRALEICRRATEIAERENALVTIQHVDQAVKQMFSSAKITALKHATKHEQLFLKSISYLYHQSGLEETNLNKIYEQHTAMCKFENIKPLNRTQLLNVCCTLAASKLILLEPSKNIYLQRVRLNMSTDDIDFALKN